MDDKQFKELIIGMSNAIKKAMCEFLSENLTEPEYDTSDIINILISSHLNSMISTTEIAAKDLDKGNGDMKEFNRKLLEYIGSLRPIKQIEFIDA